MKSVRILLNDRLVTVDVLERSREGVLFAIGERNYRVQFESSVGSAKRQEPEKSGGQFSAVPLKIQHGAQHGATASEQIIAAPIPGLVSEVLVAKGATVQEGAIVMRLEAMKMQNNIFAPCAGVVKEVFVTEGEEVRDGQALVLVTK